jgi:DNA-binding CsgD family transcriptional regulator
VRLAVSPSTVHSHVKNVLRKLGARNRVEAVAIYVADGRTHLPATG